MAIEFCRECGEQASTLAPTCPHCGTPDPTGHVAATEKGNTIAASVAVGVAGLLLVSIIAAVSAARGPAPPPPPRTHSASGAEYICERYTKERLRAPSTATFPRIPPTSTVHLGEGRYRVQTYVDAQNGFSAMIRSRIDCTVTWAGDDTWNLTSLRID